MITQPKNSFPKARILSSLATQVEARDLAWLFYLCKCGIHASFGSKKMSSLINANCLPRAHFFRFMPRVGETIGISCENEM